MARIIYSLLIYLLTPLIVLRLLWRSYRAPAYRKRWGERFGFVKAIPDHQKVIWVHAVSVGETLAAIPMIRHLQKTHSDALLVVTTTTPTGAQQVENILGDSVYHVYAPYDLPGAVQRFLQRTHPRQLIIMETELWPNIIHCCARRQVPVVIANARLSERSAKGYQRLSLLVKPMLGKITQVAAQTESDARRFLALGLTPKQLNVTGNIKFDFTLDDDCRSQARVLSEQWRGKKNRQIWLVASTHKGEDELILAAFKGILKKHPDVLLVLVPRHPERFERVYKRCVEQQFSVLCRSTGEVPGDDKQILVGDTMGELPLFFGACDIAFIGGSLVPVGGHNLIEPAAWGVPVLSGPHLFNFSAVSSLLLDAQAMVVCETTESLAEQVSLFLSDDILRKKMGSAAHSVAETNRGAMNRLFEIIAKAQ